MKFFMNRHYSTAQKILLSVETKIFNSLKACGKILEPAGPYVPLLFFTANQRQLAETLGDVLKENLPDVLYDKYQALSPAAKQQFREHIIDAYFNLLVGQLGKIQHIHMEFSFQEYDYGHFHSNSMEKHVIISLPQNMLDKAWLQAHLWYSISSAQRLLFEMDNPVLAYQNSGL